MLTPIIKPAIVAPAPLAILDAPQAGTGKSLLCDVIAIIATGRAGEMFSAPRDEDEWRKRRVELSRRGADSLSVLVHIVIRHSVIQSRRANFSAA
jgi:putative DNA primase/helicase